MIWILRTGGPETDRFFATKAFAQMAARRDPFCTVSIIWKEKNKAEYFSKLERFAKLRALNTGECSHA